MPLDELHQKLTAVVDDYIAAATAAQRAYNEGLEAVCEAALRSGVDDRLFAAMLHGQLSRMEQALAQLEEATP